MTLKMASLSASVLAIFASVPALAADIGSTKDDPIFGETRSSLVSRSGFYINGSLGIAQGDRDIAGGITGERFDADVVAPAKVGDPITYKEGASLVNHAMSFGGADEIDGTVFGGGASYLLHIPGSRVGIELGLDGSFYSDNETTLGFTGKPTDRPGTPGSAPSQDTTTGSVNFQRDFDIDLVAKGHLFVTDRWSVYAGGGLSWARASADGGHSNTNAVRVAGELDPIYVNNYDENDSSFGYVLVAGTQIWLTDRITIGAEYSFKKHDFSFDASSSKLDLPADAIRHSSDSVDVEDELHTIKAKIGFRLN
jgi:opacity protein-like surface antigen